MGVGVGGGGVGVGTSVGVGVGGTTGVAVALGWAGAAEVGTDGVSLGRFSIGGVVGTGVAPLSVWMQEVKWARASAYP